MITAPSNDDTVFTGHSFSFSAIIKTQTEFNSVKAVLSDKMTDYEKVWMIADNINEYEMKISTVLTIPEDAQLVIHMFYQSFLVMKLLKSI